jgi:hypothetical protein
LYEGAEWQNDIRIRANVPGSGGHRFEFVGKDPLAFRVIVTLLFANTFLGLSLTFGAKYFLPKASVNLPACEALSEPGVRYHAPRAVCWFADHWIAIQFILLAMIAAIFVIFRKRVRHIPPRSRPSNAVTIAALIVFVSIATCVLLSQLGWLR